MESFPYGLFPYLPRRQSKIEIQLAIGKPNRKGLIEEKSDEFEKRRDFSSFLSNVVQVVYKKKVLMGATMGHSELLNSIKEGRSPASTASRAAELRRAN